MYNKIKLKRKTLIILEDFEKYLLKIIPLPFENHPSALKRVKKYVDNISPFVSRNLNFLVTYVDIMKSPWSCR